MFQNGQKVVVVSSGDPARVIKVQAVSDGDASRYPVVDTTGVTNRDQHVQIVSGGDPTRYPQLRGLATARDTADSVITALTPAAWYRNATGVTSAGGFASQWDDYSGNARHLVQAVGTNQPAYAAGVLTFDGADNFLKETGGFTFNQPETIYYVFNQISWTANDAISDGNVRDSGRFYQRSGGAAPDLGVIAATSALTIDDGPAVGSYGIYCVVINGASSSGRLNNNTKVSGTTGAGNMGGFVLGARGDGLGEWSNIAVKEVILFAAAHDDTTQSSVITALNNALTVF